MSSIQRHMLLRLVASMAMVTGTLTVVVLLVNPEGLLALFSNGALSPWRFFLVNLLLVPTVLCHTAPLGAAIAAGFHYFHWIDDKEVMSLRNAGLSGRAIALPGIAAAVIATLFTAAMSLWLLPVTFGTLSDMVYVASHDLGYRSMKEGDFNRVAPDVTIWFQHWRSEDTIEDVSMLDRRSAGSFTLVRAPSGRFSTGDDGTTLLLKSGTTLKWSGDQGGDAERSTFEWLMVPMASIRGPVDASSRPKGWFEQPITRLFFPPAEIRRDSLNLRRWISEGHRRILMPVLCLGYVLLVLGGLMWRQTRRTGMVLRVTLLAGTLTVVHILTIITHAEIAAQPALVPLFYAYAALPALAGMGLLFADDCRWRLVPAKRRAGRRLVSSTGQARRGRVPTGDIGQEIIGREIPLPRRA